MAGFTQYDPTSGLPISVQAQSSSLNITTATVVKATPGKVFRVAVVVAGAAGTVNDCATTGTAAAGNVVCATPAATQVINLEWPCAVGIVVVPGAGQTLAVSYT